jgi:two-component system phosphate regulon response regulator PhoB
MNPLILIVEDESSLVEVLRYNLEKEGFRTETAMDGDEAILALEEIHPDLVILDWMLPHVSGIEICRQMRRKKDSRNIPIVMLTARGEETDRIRGLESGADDYVVKPFSPSELIARVRAVLRRTAPGFAEEVLRYDGLEMDLASHRVTRDARPIHLGPTEFRLLRVFMERPGRVYSREQLLDLAWGQDSDIEPRTVDVHIRRLRKALNGPEDPELIRTVRSVGYALDASSVNEATAS